MANATQSPVEIATAAVAQIESAIAVLATDHPAQSALATALATAQANLTAATDAAAQDAARASDIEAAKAAAANLPQSVLDDMLAAVEAKYAPVPEAAPEAAQDAAEAVSAAYGRKPLNPVTVERNAQVAAALASDSAIDKRARASIDTFARENLPHCTVRREAGTRFASVNAFAGAGVSGRADYQALATAIRMTLAQAPYNLRSGGQSTASIPWVSATAIHAIGAPKGNDSLRQCFTDRTEVALHPDGRFRLTAPNVAGMRYLRTDAAALAMFNGASAPTPTPEPAAEAAQDKPQAPRKPQNPPPPQDLPAASGSAPDAPQNVPTARCQDCGKRNPQDAPECAKCKRTDWRAD